MSLNDAIQFAGGFVALIYAIAVGSVLVNPARLALYGRRTLRYLAGYLIMLAVLRFLDGFDLISKDSHLAIANAGTSVALAVQLLILDGWRRSWP